MPLGARSLWDIHAVMLKNKHSRWHRSHQCLTRFATMRAFTMRSMSSTLCGSHGLGDINFCAALPSRARGFVATAWMLK